MKETILLVEDEDLVRKLTRLILESIGYLVTEAASGVETLAVIEAQSDRIDLLFTDVMMPGMNGYELAERVRAKHPDFKIMFTSGYTNGAILQHNISRNDSNFIQKPYAPEVLAQKIRQILDAGLTTKYQTNN